MFVAVAVCLLSSRASAQTGLAFTPSVDHENEVVLSRYQWDIHRAGEDPATVPPTRTRDLGRPTPDSTNVITVSDPGFFANLPDGTYVCSVIAIGPGGMGRSAPSESFTISTETPPAPGAPTILRILDDQAPPAPSEIVIYAADVPTGNLRGSWQRVDEPSAAAAVALNSTDAAAPAVEPPLAAPTHYFDVTFNALANTRYRIWVRVRAAAQSKWNDSLWVQFSDSVTATGAPTYRIGTATGLNVNMATCSSCTPAGWGWHNKAYWLADTGDVYFQSNGAHTLRLQIREDGVSIDQIVISPTRYLSSAPGAPVNDTTIVPKP